MIYYDGNFYQMLKDNLSVIPFKKFVLSYPFPFLTASMGAKAVLRVDSLLYFLLDVLKFSSFARKTYSISSIS